MSTLENLTRRPRQDRRGVVVSVDAGVAQVDVGGSTMSAALLTHTASVGPGAQVIVSWRLPQMPVVDAAFTIGAGSVEYGPELVPNPSFEFGAPGLLPTGWSRFWATPPTAQALGEWDDTGGVPHSGSAACKVAVVDLGAAVNHNVSTYNAYRVDEGITYRPGAWVKASVTGATVTVNIFTAPTAAGAEPFGAGVTLTPIGTVTNPGGAWQEIAAPFTVPAGHQWARLFLNTVTASGVVTTVWWDDATTKQIL